MSICNILGHGIIHDTYEDQGWLGLCRWKQPSITYNEFLTGVTATYNRTSLKDRVFSDYVTQLYTDCLSGVTDTFVSAGTLNAATGVVTFTNTTGGTVAVSGFDGFDSYWSANTNGSISNSGLTGNVGIGTITPNEKLTVAGSISGNTHLYISGTTSIGNIPAAGTGYTGDKILVSDGGTVEYLTTAQLKDDMAISSSSHWSESTGGISNSGLTGNVGIGTDSPGHKLSISGGALSITDDGSNAVTLTESGNGDFTIDAPDDIRLDAGGQDIVLKGDGTEFGRLTNSSADFIIRNITSDKDIIFKVNDGEVDTEVMRIDGDVSRVGIGTTAPKVKLDVHHDPTNLVDDTGGGEVVYFGTNSEDEGNECVAGKLMYLHTDGVWLPADADAVATGGYQLLGICLAGSVADSGMLIRGFFDARTYVQGAFAKGMPCYVSEDAGKVDFTAPSASGDYVRVVGYGTDTANVIYFDPDKTWVELS